MSEKCREALGGVEPFAEALGRHGLELRRGATTTLQVNVGLVCNQTCRHCHHEAGPHRPEVMVQETMDEVIAYARRVSFGAIDITGGAPELVPHLDHLLRGLIPLSPLVMLRSNLTALDSSDGDALLHLCAEMKVAIVTSLPATNLTQIDAQRGAGVANRSVAMLRRLNELGYGREETGLELNLVANPAGAFLPAAQEQAEKKFRADLHRKFGVTFNRLFTFANIPLGRYHSWLKESGNLDGYMDKLAGGFNPCTVEGLMCRSLVSVAWDGTLFDCDFNLAAGLPLGGRRIHVSQLQGRPEPGSPIATGDHCYACTAGAGFT